MIKTVWRPHPAGYVTQGGRTDVLTFAPLLANSRPLPKGRFADQASWMRWLNSAAGPSTRPHTTAAHPDRTTRLAHDERKWMRVCTKSFQYRDEFGLHKFVAGVSFAVPQTDAVRLYPGNWGRSVQPVGGCRTASRR